MKEIVISIVEYLFRLIKLGCVMTDKREKKNLEDIEKFHSSPHSLEFFLQDGRSHVNFAQSSLVFVFLVPNSRNTPPDSAK